MLLPEYLRAIATRRTVYSLNPTLPKNVTTDSIRSTIQHIIKHTPTAFNCQGNRALLLTGKSHYDIWDNVIKQFPTERGIKRPISVRDDAFGSIIFFSDQNIRENLQKKFPTWSDKFELFDIHASGAAQVQVWTALRMVEVGAHLQHYNEFITQALKGKVPDYWMVQAQLCFGMVKDKPEPKKFIDNTIMVMN